MQKNCYKLLIAYDGTHYGGWQVQPNAVSIQSQIEEALATILQTKISLIGSGRTDAGVHAKGQVAHFHIAKPLENQRKVHYSLNKLLPPDIRILSLEKTDPTFHARFSAKGKIYRYQFLLAHEQNPFLRKYAHHLPHPIDLDLLQQATQLLIGTHDFTSFSNESHKGCAAKGAIRTIKRIELNKGRDFSYLEYEADGFLYKMVRNITGTLFDIARGKIPLEELPTILTARDRSRAGACAPPEGLFLMQVLYE